MNKLSETFTGIKDRFNNYVGKNQFLFLTLIVIFVGALWRLWGVNSFKGFSADELILLKSAKALISSHWQVTASQIGQSVYIYKLAAVGSVTGFSPLLLRAFAALVGIVTSFFFFMFVRTWFNKQVALISTLFMATNTTMLILSQTINPMMMILALQLTILYIATIAFRDKNIWLFLLTSLLSCVGLFLSPLFIVTGILIFIASVAMFVNNIKIFSLYKFELLVLVIPIFIGFTGYLILSFNQITNLLSYISPGSIAKFYLNIGGNILTLFTGSQFTSSINVATEPILDPFVAVSSICGIVYAFFHSGKRKHQFVLLWLLFGIVIISLSASQVVSNIALVLPAIFILSAIMLDYLLTSWVRTFPYNRSAKIAMTLVFSIFLSLSVYYNFQKYFLAWQGNKTVQVQYINTLK